MEQAVKVRITPTPREDSGLKKTLVSARCSVFLGVENTALNSCPNCSYVRIQKEVLTQLSTNSLRTLDLSRRSILEISIAFHWQSHFACVLHGILALLACRVSTTQVADFGRPELL